MGGSRNNYIRVCDLVIMALHSRLLERLPKHCTWPSVTGHSERISDSAATWEVLGEVRTNFVRVE